MKAQRFSIHLQDEVPNLGSGLRVVVALVGHKGVRARNELAPQFTRVKRAVWDTLHPRLIGPAPAHYLAQGPARLGLDYKLGGDYAVDLDTTEADWQNEGGAL